MFPRKLYPGQKLTAAETNDLQRAVHRQANVTGSGQATIAQTASGTVIRDNTPERIYGRISGAPTGSVYPWVEVAWNGSSWVDIDGWPGRGGTAASGGAKELAGRTDVPTNSIVQLSPLPGGGGWGFGWGQTNAINSQNTDGTQVDATTTDLRFNKSTGLQVTQSSGISTVTGILATAAQVGTVDTAAQTVGGQKTAVTGTDSSLGAWRAAYTVSSGLFSWSPYQASVSPGAAATGASSITHVVYTRGGSVTGNGTVLADSMIFGFLCQAGAALGSSANTYRPEMSFVVATPNTNVVDRNFVCAGFPWDSTSYYSSFGVFRSDGLKQGIDVSFSFTVSGVTHTLVFHGGILTSYSTSP